MLTNSRRTPGGRTAVIYVTVGALIDVWSGIWGISLLNDPARGGSAWYWCYGFLLTGATLVLIGLTIGWIGRTRRPRPHAAVAHDDVSSAAAADELPVAHRGPGLRSGHLAGAPSLGQGDANSRTVG